MLKVAELYDFSDYPTDHPNFSLKNKKKLGLFKDEGCSIPLCRFCGLRSKMYAMEFKDGKVTRKSKGSKKYAVKKTSDLPALQRRVGIWPSQVAGGQWHTKLQPPRVHRSTN